ncbi:aldehyde dehydrogenase [Sporichthya sp.]|uniref:aldehyde dehydrogenase n=1 Tax=Sporichthya sp. TaxID=65475 RepID=UPI0017CC6695|nr:aldehyde dehydrogenase [Sporichthya sp.]MBA3741405.1 aldehyde dehydrogenase [Sporichthya sp.]
MDRRAELFIGGRWVKPQSDQVIEVFSPATEELIGEVPEGSPADIDAAVTSARVAVDGDWGRSSAAERAAVLARFTEELSKRMDDIVTAQVSEQGAPVSQVAAVGSGPSLDVIRYYTKLAAELIAEEVREGSGGRSLIRRVPVGVVGAIVPWNGAWPLAIFKLAPAMAAGCSVVVKPPPETPLSPNLMAEAAAAAGVPEGVLSVVPGGAEVGEHLVSHTGVDKVSFTGSDAVGKKIAAICGGRLRSTVLELGGKSAAIVLEDADLASTVGGLALNSYVNNGEGCMSDTRILVPRSRHDEFVEAFGAMASSLKVGDPFDPTTFIGPLISERQRDRVEGYIFSGVEQGATLVTGGRRPAHLAKGWFVEPTVFANVDNSMRIAREEIFGPVVSIIAYSDEAEAVAISNDSDYGLGGSIWSSDVDHALALSAQVRTGIMAINGFGFQECSPFGGMKNSGLGWEMGPEGLNEYLALQSILLGAGSFARHADLPTR